MCFGHWFRLCPLSQHLVHCGGARWGSDCVVFEGPATAGSTGSLAFFSTTTGSFISPTIYPLLYDSCCADLARFIVCLAFASRSSSFCWPRNIALCIAISQPFTSWSTARWVGLVGLVERRRSSAFTDDACLPNCLGFWGVFMENSLPLLWGGVGVLSWILSVSITRFGSNGTKPVAAKLFLTVSNL